MKKYRSHKIVEASYINGWGDGSNLVVDGGTNFPLSTEDAERIQKMMAKHPDDTGILVRYEDGYLSWSPTDVFEAGYTEA